MEFVIATALALASIAYISQPMLTKKRFFYHLEDMFDLGDARQLNYLVSKKASILDNLKELDFENDIGKLSEEDYARLRQEYLIEAQEVVKAIDTLKVKKDIEDMIEEEVRSRRRIQ